MRVRYCDTQPYVVFRTETCSPYGTGIRGPCTVSGTEIGRVPGGGGGRDCPDPYCDAGWYT
eukprot:86832-Rhodomonas_salina.5